MLPSTPYFPISYMYLCPFDLKADGGEKEKDECYAPGFSIDQSWEHDCFTMIHVWEQGMQLVAAVCGPNYVNTLHFCTSHD